jgi:uncharacterized repeat protein (TIGR03803 family)
MRSLGLRHYALAIGTAAALLAGCGGSQPPISAPGAMPQSRSLGGTLSAQTQDTSVPDGSEPDTRLVALNGKLYGTTRAGGANNQGTVYGITTTGAEQVLHSFATGCQKAKKCADGAIPTGLVHVTGTLYGTTGGGGVGPCKNPYGPNGCGTVFSVTTGGAEKVLYSVGSGCRHPNRCNDAYPNGLSAINGTLYGTSWYGGRFGLGTVYSVTTGGVEKRLHSFGRGGRGDGGSGYPNPGLIDVDGTLYGTTLYGGAQGAGFVFTMSKSGRTKVLYSFDAPPPGDGSAGANGGLVDVNGVLYGTTSEGGAYHDNGTAFSITTNGTVNVLHNFGAGCNPVRRCSDGVAPDAGLLDVKGILYGTTARGGKHASGTVFSLTTNGSEKLLHSFAYSNGPPIAGLTELHGTLYGATVYGGTCGDGTVYSITLSGTVKVLHSFC